MSLSVLFVLLAHLAGLLSAYDATVCGTNGYSAPSGSFAYSANAWNAAAGGFQCISINNSQPAFDARWRWPTNTTSVHSFPYVSFVDGSLPAVLSNISALQLTARWGMAPASASLSPAGSVPADQLDTAGLVAQATKANVAFDMFLHLNASEANAATTASTEIMIWLATVGGAKALGYAENRTCFTQKLGSVDYVLYTGINQRGLDVYTWVAETNVTSFDEDISPLLQYLWRNELISSNLSIGLLQFGSEAYSSDGNVTFSASGFSMDLEHGTAPELDVSSLPSACSSATRRSSSRSMRAWVAAASCTVVAHLLAR